MTPRIFHVNWFRKDEEESSYGLGPGKYEGSNLDRRQSARQSSRRRDCNRLGPRYDEIEWYSKERFHELQTVKSTDWKQEIMAHEELFLLLHSHLPPEMIYERELLICNCEALRLHHPAINVRLMVMSFCDSEGRSVT